ncbi:hypothetical protein B484DRAFT_440815, partial [Ochromonadaceae sp. CCMP2298]
EAAAEGLVVDENELNAKFAIAQSVLETFAGQDVGDVGELLRWAADMQLLRQDMETAYVERLPCKALCFNCPEGLLNWYRDLELRRGEADRAAVAGSLLSDTELRRMAALDKIASMGTAGEQLLHSLIGRHDEGARQRQVANGVDLETVSDELHESVYSVVSAARGAEVVNVLLDLHVLEDEQELLKGRIDGMLGSPDRDRDGDSEGHFFGADSKDE